MVVVFVNLKLLMHFFFQINDNIPSSMCQLLSAPVLNSTAISTDDTDNETPIVS